MYVSLSEVWPIFTILGLGIGAVSWLHLRLQVSRDELSEHKLYCEKTFLSKEFLREFKDEMMGAMRATKSSVDDLNLRIDSIVLGIRARSPEARTRQSDAA